MKKIFFLLVFALISIQYSFAWGYNTPLQPYFQTKPFIYRTLVPSLAHYLPFGFEANVSILVFLSCIGLGASMLAIYQKYWKQTLWNDAALIVSFSVTILILEGYKKYYDVPTAFLCLLTYYLWIEKRYVLGTLTFTLLCLNRETAILLVPVLFFSKFSMVPVLIYGLTRWMTLWLFSSAEGLSVHIHFLRSFLVYAQHPFMTIVLVLTGWAVFLLFLIKLPNPKIIAYVLWFVPVIGVLYVIAGYPFEIRVFAEVFPLLFMGAFLK